MAKDVMYLVCFNVYLNNMDDPLKQWIATDDAKLASRLKGVNYEDEGSCCGQTKCFACAAAGLTINWRQTESLPSVDYLKNKKLWDMLICSNRVVSLDVLVESLGEDQDDEEEEEPEEDDDSDESGQTTEEDASSSRKKRRTAS
eukprot:TRINITY_DN5465_c0_g1_i1.p1 TRINITY_DN5465_c0_g1~~TRINITY_DN5465_c0_g1_i1.p1  ORF type:complete len:158 (-),score=42.82 TRINITY_DN5465_c0_g1_i1:68-499(-)